MTEDMGKEEYRRHKAGISGWGSEWDGGGMVSTDSHCMGLEDWMGSSG